MKRLIVEIEKECRARKEEFLAVYSKKAELKEFQMADFVLMLIGLVLFLVLAF